MKPKNFLEVYISNILYDSTFNKLISQLVLSKIDNNNSQQLKFDMISFILSQFLEQAKVSSNKNDLIDLNQL